MVNKAKAYAGALQKVRKGLEELESWCGRIEGALAKAVTRPKGSDPGDKVEDDEQPARRGRSPKKAERKRAADKPKSDEPTIEDVRSLMRRVADAFSTQDAIDTLEEVAGVTKLKDVDEDAYPDLVEKLEEALAKAARSKAEAGDDDDPDDF